MWPHRPVRAPPRKIDVLGGTLIPPAIAAPLLAVHFSRHWTWLDARTLGLLAAGLALLVFWIFYESRQNDPLIDVRLLKRRQIGLANLGMALFGLGALQNVQVLSMLLQQPAWTGAGLGVSATTTGLLFVPFIVINLIGGPLSGRVAARYTSRIAALVGMCLTSVGWIAIALEHSSLVFVMACGYLQTLGVAMLFAALPNLVVEDTPRDRTSEATGVLSVVRQFAASIGTQIVGFTLSTSTVADEAGVHFPSEKAVMLTLGFIAVISALAIVATMLLPRRVPLRAGA